MKNATNDEYFVLRETRYPLSSEEIFKRNGKEAVNRRSRKQEIQNLGVTVG